MCIPNEIITARVNDLIDLKKLADELQSEIDAVTDEIKTYMGDEAQMLVGPWTITYKPVTQNRLDSVKLKKDLGDALEGYYKTVTVRPFKIS